MVNIAQNRRRWESRCDDRAVRILVVEDDPSIADPLVTGLERHGFEATLTSSGLVAINTAANFDLVLLDLGLPDLDGTEVSRRIRAAGDTAIIVVSARSEEFERVMLLELGADDYVVKPFGLRELVARIRAVSRRWRPSTADPTETAVGALKIDHRSHVATLDGTEIRLTPKEFDLLAFLATKAGTMVDRTELLNEVWGSPHFVSKTLDVHVASLRRKLGNPQWITTVRGVGFRIDANGPHAADAP